LAPAFFGTVDDGDVVGFPTVEVSFRHGINERFDFGLRAHPVGLQADFNVLLVDSGAFALSVDPALSVFTFVAGDEPFGLLYLWLPLLMDVYSSDTVTLTVGPKAGMFVGGKPPIGGTEVVGGNRAAFAGGGVLAVVVRVGERFSLVPEVDAYYVSGAVDDAVMWNATIGLLF
jgi:hypothetical protein